MGDDYYPQQDPNHPQGLPERQLDEFQNAMRAVELQSLAPTESEWKELEEAIAYCDAIVEQDPDLAMFGIQSIYRRISNILAGGVENLSQQLLQHMPAALQRLRAIGNKIAEMTHAGSFYVEFSTTGVTFGFNYQVQGPLLVP